MKKVRFDASGSIALHIKLGRPLTPDQRKPVKLEGWLVGDHICVQKPQADDRGWCLSLYPWGDKLSPEFFAKVDAIACAKQIDALDIPSCGRWISNPKNIEIMSAGFWRSARTT